MNNLENIAEVESFDCDILKVMEANRDKATQEEKAKYTREDEELLRVFSEAVKNRDSKRIAETQSNDVMVKAVNKAKKINASSGLNVNIRGAEQSARVRVSVDDGAQNVVNFSNVCSFITLLLVGAMFVLKIMEVM